MMIFRAGTKYAAWASTRHGYKTGCLEVVYRNDLIRFRQRYYFVVKANNAARAAFHIGNMVKFVESRDVLFCADRRAFLSQWDRASRVFYQQVDLVHILIPVKVERRFGDSLVIVALDDLRKDEVFKERSAIAPFFSTSGALSQSSLGVLTTRFKMLLE